MITINEPKLLIFYEKHEHAYYLVNKIEEYINILRAVAEKRLNEGWYNEYVDDSGIQNDLFSTNKSQVDKIRDILNMPTDSVKYPNLLNRFMFERMRNDHQYERFELESFKKIKYIENNNNNN